MLKVYSKTGNVKDENMHTEKTVGKKDSGFGSDSSNREDADDDIIYRGRPSKKKARDKKSI